jgi:hypothetical protein
MSNGRAYRAALAGIVVPAMCVGLCAAAGRVPPDQSASAETRGKELARRVVRSQDTSGFRSRARVIVGRDTDPAPPRVLQLLLLGRREADRVRLLFQVFWPRDLKGHAAVVVRARRLPLDGFLFDPPDRVTPLTPALTLAPFASTALTIEDLADDFWDWPTQAVTGEGRADGQRCTLLESTPSRVTVTGYSLVRSCIDPKRAVPRWVEKYGPRGELIKRLTFERRRGRQRSEGVALALVVTGDSPLPPTRVEFIRSERDLVIPPADFTPAQLRRIGPGEPGTLAFTGVRD